MQLLKRIYIPIMERILKHRRKIIFNHKAEKKAIVSYVLYPPKFNKKYFAISHNNRLMCKLMVDVLIESGFRVELYNYLDLDANVDDAVIFIGHNRTFHMIANKCSESCIKILLTTGSSPFFDIEQIKLRCDYLYQRHGISLNYNTEADEHVFANGNTAHYVYLMGSNFIANTWPSSYVKKAVPYHNVSQFLPQRKSGRNNAFVFMSNHGQLRRGLDLVIDVFATLDITLYICSPCKNELSFMGIYEDIIKKSSNIHFMGFVNTNSNTFKRIVEKSDYVILPSCSEGEASSVLNLMVLGLIPVITPNVGLEAVNNFGYLIEDYHIDKLKQLILFIIAQSDTVIAEKRANLLQEVKKYLPAQFTQDFRTFVARTDI